MAGELEWEGLDTLLGVMTQSSPRATAYLRNQIVDAMFEVFDLSQDQVPVRYGVLKGSGHVETISEDPIEVSIGYGGPAAGYAFWVHENLEARHKPPTKAKYLEDPMNQIVEKMPSRVESRIDAAILGQYPQQASMAQGREVGTATVAHTGGRSRKGTSWKGVVSRAAPMTRADIHEALQSIDRGNRALIRKRGRGRPS